MCNIQQLVIREILFACCNIRYVRITICVRFIISNEWYLSSNDVYIQHLIQRRDYEKLIKWKRASIYESIERKTAVATHSRFAHIELLPIAPFHVILSTLILTSFSTLVRGLLSNLIKDSTYDFHLKPRVNFLNRG